MVTNSQWKDWERYWQDKIEDNPRAALADLQFRFEYSVSPWLVRALNRYLEVMMARGKGKVEAPASSNGTNWTKFVDIPVSNVSWEAVLAKFGSNEQIDQAVRDLVENGYRIGLSYNGASDAFICSITCRDDGSPNHGYTFTSFASTWLAALQIACFKHFVISDCSWPTNQKPMTGPMFG